MTSVGFAPVSAVDARVLVLGSLPGEESLRRQQYYAKPANRFWWIMGEIFGAGPEVPYQDRLARLVENRIALWDVCCAAQRGGSLDADIVTASVIANDFPAFLQLHTEIELICLNGGRAASLFTKCVLPHLPQSQAPIRRVVLPSTSPAYAAMRPAEKLTRWRVGLALP